MSAPLLSYGETELRHLRAADAGLAAAIDRIGRIERAAMPDLFAALLHAIAGQQVSSRAQETIWGRLCALLGSPTPQAVLSAGTETIRGCGLSLRKAGYMLSAARAFASGAIDADSLAAMPDEAAVRALTALPGVGVWTAKMLLLFSLQRPDVLCFEDYGLRNGCRILLGLDAITRPQFEAFAARCSPYGTTASLYLWEVNRGR